MTRPVRWTLTGEMGDIVAVRSSNPFVALKGLQSALRLGENVRRLAWGHKAISHPVFNVAPNVFFVPFHLPADVEAALDDEGKFIGVTITVSSVDGLPTDPDRRAVLDQRSRELNPQGAT